MPLPLISRLTEDARGILVAHLSVGPHKSVSYLPINTIKNILNLSIEEYCTLLEHAHLQFVVLGSDRCCIKSGAVYAFSRSDLDNVLRRNSILLSGSGWPVGADDFVLRMASEWLADDNPALAVVREAFGEKASD